MVCAQFKKQMLMNCGISFFDMWKGFLPTQGQSGREEKDFTGCEAAVFRGCFPEQFCAENLLRKLFAGEDALKKSEKLAAKLPDLW